MAVPGATSNVWIKTLLAAGGLLAVALLAQTVLNYRFVSTNLIRQEARRTAEQTVRGVERSARLARPQDAEAFRVILDDIRGETSEQIASIALLRGDGAILTAVGQTASALAPAQRERLGRDRDVVLNSDRRDGRNILVGVFPCRCNL